MKNAKDAPAWVMTFLTGFSAVTVIGVVVYVIASGQNLNSKSRAEEARPMGTDALSYRISAED